MRRARPALTPVLAALVAGLVATLLAGTVLLPLDRAAAETTRLPGTLSTVAQRTGPLTVTVPPGVTPSGLRAVVAADRVVAGASVVVLVNGREAARVPSSLYTRVTVPVGPADVVADGTLALSLRYDTPPGATGCEVPPATTLRRLELDYTGLETPPTTVAGFFPDGASRVDVRLPPEPGDDLVAAGLNAVAALSARYDADTPVELSTTDTPLPSVGAGQRVVSLAADPSGVSTSITAEAGVPTLLVSGSGSALTDAVAALGSENLTLAGGAGTGALAAQPLRRPESLTRTLAELGSGSAPSPLAPATGSIEVPLRQDSFGGPVSAMRVHLEGTHSAVPAGVSARLDVYVDDTLVDSTLLGTDARIERDVEVPSDLVRGSGTLRATISSATATAATTGDPTGPADPAAPAPVPPAGAGPAQCSPGLPVQLALDTDASTVTATRGLGDLHGFELFPAVLEGRLPVALRQTGPARTDAAVDAARLVSAVQRHADTPLEVTLVDPDELVAGEGSGLLVGADEQDTRRVGAALDLAGTRSVETDQSAFEVEIDTPFAALQALGHDGRFLLVLGSWAPGGTDADPRLAHRITQRVTDDGWGALRGDVLLLDRGAPPFVLDTGAPMVDAPSVPEASETSETSGQRDQETSYVGWSSLYVVALLGLLALLLGRTLKRRNEDADASAPPTRAPGSRLR